MRLFYVLIGVFMLLTSCDSNSDISVSDPAQDDVTHEQKPHSRILKADAPKLEDEIIHPSGFVGNIFSYRRNFIETDENIEIPRTAPIGAGPEYILKRDENDSGLIPVSKRRLRLRKDNSPYSGKIYLHYLSGEIEHFSSYKNGFRQEKAYWWKKDGNLSKVSEGWGFDYQEIALEEVSKNPVYDLQSEMRQLSPSNNYTATFSGTYETWRKWSTVNSDGITICLENGENLQGDVRIYSSDGFLKDIKRFNNGLLDGESATFHSNGVQATSIQYRNGVKDGKETWWSDKGLKTYAANYLDGKLHGATYSWDERGYLISEAKFDNGNPVRPTSYAE